MVDAGEKLELASEGNRPYWAYRMSVFCISNTDFTCKGNVSSAFMGISNRKSLAHSSKIPKCLPNFFYPTTKVSDTQKNFFAIGFWYTNTANRQGHKATKRRRCCLIKTTGWLNIWAFDWTHRHLKSVDSWIMSQQDRHNPPRWWWPTQKT